MEAAKAGELRSETRKGTAALPRETGPHFDELVAEWRDSKSLDIAADLLSSGVAHGRFTEPDVRDAAELIERSGSTEDLRHLAGRVLGGHVGASSPAQPISFEYQLALAQLRAQVASAKRWVRKYPRNAIAWTDLARLYVASGQQGKARKAMEVATALAPENRFVLRAAARFSVHADDRDNAENIEEGLRLLRRSRALRSDAWLMAAELSLSTILRQTPKTLMLARRISDNDSILPWDSAELNGALGTFAIEQGGLGKPSKYFARSLRVPTENALAQAQWASNTHNAIAVSPDAFRSPESVPHEALALRYRAEQRWLDVIQSCRDWSVMEPTSTRPLILGTFVAEVALADGAIALEFAERARLMSPNEPWVTNNLAVALVYSGRIDEAGEVMARIEPANLQEASQPAVLATRGLIEYRKGNVSEGARLYLQAARCTAAEKDDALRAMVMWHLLQEEARLGTTGLDEMADLLMRRTHALGAPEMGALRARVIESSRGPLRRTAAMVRAAIRRPRSRDESNDVLREIDQLFARRS